MKMNKTLIAAAVASVCAAPMAAQAEVFGEFIAGVENLNEDARGVDGDGDTNVVLDTAAIGAEGGEDLGNGLRVDAGVVFEAAAPTGGGDSVEFDSAFGTFSGDFGSLTLGYGIDSVYYMHVYAPVDQGVIYDTYSFEPSPLSGASGTSLGTNDDEAERTIQYGYNAGAFTFNAGVEMSDEGNNDPDNDPTTPGDKTETADRIGIGASFDAGVVTIGAAHQSSANAASGGAEPSQTGFSVSGDVGPATLAAQYSAYDNDDPNDDSDPTSLDLIGSMDFGGGLGGLVGVGMIDADNDNDADDETRFHAQLTQSLSSRTYVFGQLYSASVDGGTGDDTDPRALFVGMGHEF